MNARPKLHTSADASFEKAARDDRDSVPEIQGGNGKDPQTKLAAAIPPRPGALDFQHLPGLEASLDLVSRLSAELTKQSPPPYRSKAYDDTIPAKDIPKPQIKKVNWSEIKQEHDDARVTRSPLNQAFVNRAYLQKAPYWKVLKKYTTATHGFFVTKAKEYPAIAAITLLGLTFISGFGTGYLAKKPGVPKIEVMGSILENQPTLATRSNAASQGDPSHVLPPPDDGTSAPLGSRSNATSASSPESDVDDFDIKLPTANMPVANNTTSPAPNVPAGSNNDSTAKDSSTAATEQTNDAMSEGSGDDIADATDDLKASPTLAPKATPEGNLFSHDGPPIPQIPGADGESSRTSEEINRLRINFHKKPAEDSARAAFANALAYANTPSQDLPSIADELQSLASNRPKLAPIQAALGVFYARHNDLENATLYLNQAIKLDEENVLYHFELATVYDRSGNAKLALSFYRHVLLMAAHLDSGAQATLPLSAIQTRAQYLTRQVIE